MQLNIMGDLMRKENFKLRREDELLLCCARTNVDHIIKERIVSLIDEDFDWKHLVDMASRHRLRPLLYHNLNSICPELVPEYILVELKEYFNANVRKNLLMSGELIKLLELLKANNINAIPYKGPVLANLTYGNVSFRDFGDIDILIDRSDAINVKNLMILHGYRLYSPLTLEDSIYIKLESEYRFKSKNTEVNIDINWNFEGILFSFPNNPNFLFKNLELINFNSLEICNFSPVNQLLMLSIHCAKHDWKRLIWLCDISEFLMSQKIDWNEALVKAEKLGVKRILFINLLLSKDFFSLKIPNQILYKIDSDYYVKKISYEIKNSLFKSGRSFNIFDKFFIDLRRRENIKYGLKDCLKGLTKYSYKDFEDLPLPKQLFPFYIFIRPLLLLKRYGKDPV